MRKIKALIACEESQRISTEFNSRGWETYSCDIQPCSGGHPEFHILGDCVPLLNGDCEFKTQDGTTHTIDGPWDLIIAHPPCTYFSCAGAINLYKQKGVLNMERYQKGLPYKKLFLDILNARCKRIAVENPVPMKVWQLPRYTQTIQPWMFSDGDENVTKKTCLWLQGLPNLIPGTTAKPADCKPFVWYNRVRKDGVRISYGSTFGSKERSKTFNGIAKAIAKQWGTFIENEISNENG